MSAVPTPASRMAFRPGRSDSGPPRSLPQSVAPPAPGAVARQAAGPPPRPRAAAPRIRVMGWTGAAPVESPLPGGLTPDRRVVVCLANQDDSFTADLAGNVGAGGQLALWVYGGNG